MERLKNFMIMLFRKEDRNGAGETVTAQGLFSSA